MRLLFLCTEIAGYFANCIQQLSDETKSSITIVYWPKVVVAPFEINLKNIELVDKSSISRVELLNMCINLNPVLVYIGGWGDKDYKVIAKCLKKKGAITIGGLDNPWKGSLRQRAACLLSYLLIKPYYTYLRVSGHRQYQFAKRLGYAYDHIITGLYVADIDRFRKIPALPIQKYIVFVGRFESEKGVKLLYDVFSGLSFIERRGWTLRMIGNGTLKNSLNPTPEIEIFDFMQPDELANFVADAGGFILPSYDEPWGVVVQEFAAAGKPLLLSSAVNSGETYLIHNYNGLKFKCGDPIDMKKYLLHFFDLSEETRNIMGQRSSELAMKEEPKYWVAKFLSLIPE